MSVFNSKLKKKIDLLYTRISFQEYKLNIFSF